MSTYTQILYQIVFGTKSNEQTMIEPGQKALYKYIRGILKNKKCHLYRINGVEDHLIEYVKNQKEHHKEVNFRDEYIGLLKEHRIEFDEKFLL